MTTYTSVFGDDAIPAAEQSYASVSLTSDQAFYWSELSVGDFLLHDLMDIHSAGAYAITLPAANAVSVGRSVTLTNRSAYTISVKDNAGSEVTSLGTGMTKIVYITDNSSAAGVWGVVFLGTGTSVADASALAGGGLKVVDSKLAINVDMATQIASYSVVLSDRARSIVFTGTGAASCSLLQSSMAGNGFLIGLVNQGTGSVTVDPYSGELVDEQLVKEIAPGESAFIVCNGSNWFTIGHGRSTQFQFTKLVFDVSSGTPFTLTSTQAQNKLMQFIGTVTGNVVVNVPAVVAVYYVQCSYSGAFSLTLKTAAGGGVVLATGDRAILYCDGIDVVSAQTSAVPATDLAGGVTGAIPYQSAPNLTDFSTAGIAGQLLVSGGSGAPTWTSSPSVTNLQSSGTLTHSGDVLLSGSGKRIKGDFSNATIANRVMFQTSTVNGGTEIGAITNGSGSTSTVSVYNGSDANNASVTRLGCTPTDSRLAATNSGTGTYLPMTFYTNGSERMRIDTSGNVSVGTNSALAPLTLYNATNPYMAFGNTTFSTYLNQTASDFHLYTNGAYPLRLGTNNTERMRIGTSGQIGIAGANYGTSGQALVSNGSDAAPSWQTISSGVTSVAGRTGAVTLSKSDVGLSNVDNTADASKSVDNSAKLGGVAAANYSQTSHTHSYAPMTAVVAISSSTPYSSDGYTYYHCIATRANGATFTFNI